LNLTDRRYAYSHRFVVLRHEGVEVPHFDLMFETSPGSALATWRSERWPLDRPTIATRIGDHRSAYLEFEGELSGNRGHVKRVSSGTCFVEQLDNGEYWAVHFADPFRPTISLKHGEGDLWLAMPTCA
jgi:hypothetical protein